MRPSEGELMRQLKQNWRVLVLVWVAGLAPQATWAEEALAPPVETQAAVDFDAQIRPLLAKHCLRCHGPGDPEAGLNLGNREAAIESGAVVPGEPEESSLLQRIANEEAAERMPPEGSPLPAEDVALVKRWIEAGADWPQHWAYRPLAGPRLPRVDSPQLAAWAETPIDRFIARRLGEHGLSPSPDAGRRVLLRRASFDLLGLPPTPEQLQGFLNDRHPGAWHRAVDRMLADPRYGERWGRHWMDLVHFAETHGHDQDRPREHAWPYRDYLIHSLNSDKPYARFVAEQIAGDVLAPTDPEAIVATGMLAAGPWDESSLRDIREDSIDRLRGRYLDRDDIVMTVMSTFASTSVHCARCHDHKFDPISQDDYYALQAVFAATDKANRMYDADPQVARRRAELEAERLQIGQWLADRAPQLLDPAVEDAIAAWQRDREQRIVDWSALEVLQASCESDAALRELEDGSFRAEGVRADKDVYTLVGKTGRGQITGLRIEVLTDDQLPQGGPGRQDNGNLHLNEVVLEIRGDAEPTGWRRIPLVRPVADFNQQDWGIPAAVDGDPTTAWGIYPEVGKSHWAHFELAAPLNVDAGTRFRLQLHQVHGGGHLIGRFRVSLTDHAVPLPNDGGELPADIAAALEQAPESRSEDQRLRLAAWYRTREVDAQLAVLPPPQLVYCGTNRFEPDGSFRPQTQPPTVHVLRRGLVSEPLRVAEPGGLHYLEHHSGHFELKSPQDEGQRRLALAHWLADRRHSVVWRSIVNRLWHHHFGRGLVDTANDFGHLGSAPTHPELLDWLAVELQENHGSLKALHRQILTSRVYRQSSQIRAEAAEIDRDNRWLWRMPRRRMDAESFRDSLLVASATLDNRMGGPSDRLFDMGPGVHVTPVVDYQSFDVDDPANYRRSVYRFIFRTIPDPFMDALDCPDASQLTPERNSSLTAIQAMATLNDPFVVRQAERLAERIERQTTEPDEQIEAAYRWLLARRPSESEAPLLAAYLREHGLANACRLLINSNEYLFVD